MNKRAFLKRSLALVTSNFVTSNFFPRYFFAPLIEGFARPRLMAEQSMAESEPRTNWAGNFQYSTDKLYEAKSVEEVQEIVRQCKKLRALGTRHCFNRIADSAAAQISVREMNRIVSVDPQAKAVVIEAGISYGQLCPALHERGFALHNLASLPHISVAGACATATHGSGVKNGNLATAVRALEFVNAQGDLVTLMREKDGERFQGAVVNLGALGIITKLTLEVQPTYYMKQVVYRNLPLKQLTENFRAIENSGYSVSLFTDWTNRNINQVWIKSRVDAGHGSPSEPEFYGAKAATRNLHPLENLSAENCTEQMGVPGPWYERLPHFRMGFTPSNGDELQSEYFVPADRAVEAILAIFAISGAVTPHLFISEIRTIAADDLWMSPCFGGDCVAIHFTWKPDWPAVQRALPVIEKALAPFGARPHWGKLFTMSPEHLQPLIQKLPQFRELLAQYDAGGKFRNQFIDANIFSA